MRACSVWTWRAALVLVCSVAPGCDGVPPPSAVPPGQTLTALDRDDDLRGDTADAGCSFELAADEALAGAVDAAAERWSAATGCQIVRGETERARARFALVPSVLRPDGSEAPAKTTADRSRVEVSARTGQRQRQSTVLHELGHVLGGDHTASGGVLSGAPEGRSDVIDAEALETVCARLACAFMAPEGP